MSPPPRRLKPLTRSLLQVALLLVLLVLPFVLVGAAFEAWARDWLERRTSAPAAALALIGLLATDIFLPIPSSVLSTLGGWRLGWLGGTVASWLGMTLGASLGYALARRWGRPFAVRFSDEEELARLQVLADRYGPAVLVVTRGVPVLAEASVLLLGLHRIGWWRFLPPVAAANLGIAVAYSAFGDFAERHEWLPLALGVSIAVPVLLAISARVWFGRSPRAT